MANATSRVTFTIDDHNNIATCEEGAQVEPGLQRFTTQQELEALAADWPSSRFLDIWNQIPGNIPVRKFTNRQTAIRRIWSCLERRMLSAAAPAVRPSKPRKAKNPTHPVPQTAATKSEAVLALLRQPGGATLKALMTATGWQAHSVRGFISGQLTKKLRLKVKSVKRDGERVYSIRS
jgi:hypothetical protein